MSRLSRRQFLSASGALAAGAAFARFGLSAEREPESLMSLAAGNTRFGCELYDKLRNDEGNLFLSPFSISTALAMTAAGARGQTLAEMNKVLHLPETPHAAFGAVIKSLNEQPPAGKKRGFELSTANALWAHLGHPWKASYMKLAADDYSAALRDVDFVRHPEDSRATINDWVEKQTREKIKELLPKGTIDERTRLVLTNAIYFKGDWAVPFKKELTKDQPFHLPVDKSVDAPLMHRIGTFQYHETDAYQTIDLPYTGGRIGMTVILPRKPDGLPAVEKQLTADKLAADRKAMRTERDVRLFLPRFKVEKAFKLKGPLVALGMKSAFVGADFSGMSDGGEPLDISDVLHKAFVDVNEEGTEAAAATGVVMKLSSAPVLEPKVFRADRPFLFLIRDAKTNSTLFMGRVTNPKG